MGYFPEKHPVQNPQPAFSAIFTTLSVLRNPRESTPIISAISSTECLLAMRFSLLSMSVPKKHSLMNGGEEIRICISVAPACRSSFTTLAEVVPRTILSSMSTTRLPFTVSLSAFSLIFTEFSRMPWVG